MSTQGDKILDVALAKIGDKGLFTKELEEAILAGRIDFAVHSLKDLPTHLPPGLMLGAITKRENPADALVLHARHQGKTIGELPPGSVIGTSSLRRLAQLRHHFPNLQFKDVRGNVNTRLAKLDSGEFDGLILAVAGLKRLGLAERIGQILPPEISLHAVGQGALGIECREGDTTVLPLFQPIVDFATTQCCLAERAFLRELEGGCQVPIGVNSVITGERLTLRGMVATLDGQTLVQGVWEGDINDPETIGINLAQHLKEQGAQAILDQIFAQFRQP
jgi:hydroxymethylbilane synthase